MGGSSGSTSSTNTYSRERMSPLAETQNEILKNREELFQNYFLPEFKNFFEEIDPDSSAGQAQMGLTANEINKSFDAAKKQTSQTLAQRNMLYSGAGAALDAANNRARSSALANAYAQQKASSVDKKATALATFGQTMPTPTTAAPTLTDSDSSSKSEQYQWNFL